MKEEIKINEGKIVMFEEISQPSMGYCYSYTHSDGKKYSSKFFWSFEPKEESLQVFISALKDLLNNSNKIKNHESRN